MSTRHWKYRPGITVFNARSGSWLPSLIANCGEAAGPGEQAQQGVVRHCEDILIIRLAVQFPSKAEPSLLDTPSASG